MISFINKGIVITLLLGLLLAGCNNDSDPIPKPDPDPNPITTIKVDPKEVSFNEIGLNQQFSAKAYDKDGREINTLFTWSSSDVGVVAVGSNGLAEAIGPGNASIYVTAETISDTAQVVVELPENPSIWWASATNGDWSDSSKWSTGVVPAPTDTVAIPLEGDYTVTLTTDDRCLPPLGAPDGTQTLATGTNQLTTQRGKLIGGAELQVDGKAIVENELAWQGGEITGSGTMEIAAGATVLAVNGSRITLKATIANSGVLALESGVTMNISGGVLEINPGALVDFQGDDIWISSFSGGTFNNQGNIIKSEGLNDARISTSSTTIYDFVSTGFIGVESGNLTIAGGDFDGVIDVDAGAEFHQSGKTLIQSTLINRGAGIFEINGSVTLGEQLGDLIRLNNLVFDGDIISGISGPGDLEIDNSFLWRKGGMSGAGLIYVDGAARFEGSGWKIISMRTLEFIGTLETESLLKLTLEEGAQIKIGESSAWTHTGGGNIEKSVGSMPVIEVLGSFRKRGQGALVVQTDFTCAGKMFLEEDVLTVKGAFELQETGTIIGGSTNTTNEVNYRRLQVPEATSAVLAGTIDVDADGDLAFMSIQGAVTIAPTFNVLVDIDKNNTLIPAERLVFETGSVALNGTLDINILGAPPENVEYRVVSTIGGTGAFTNITGNGEPWFTEIREDADGVLLIRN